MGLKRNGLAKKPSKQFSVTWTARGCKSYGRYGPTSKKGADVDKPEDNVKSRQPSTDEARTEGDDMDNLYARIIEE